MKMPKTIGAGIDKLYTMKQQMDQFNKLLQKTAEAKKITKLQADYKELEEHLIESFKKQDLDGSQGKIAKLTVSKKSSPTVTDWPKFYAHVKKTGNFDLLQKRVSSVAVNERWKDNKQVPGVGAFISTKLSLTKLPSK